VDEVQANALGGFIRVTWLGGDNCRGQFQRFKYSWSFQPPDITVFGGKLGARVISVNLSIDGDNNVCMNLNPFFAVSPYGDLLGINQGGEVRFYWKPQPGGYRNPFVFSIKRPDLTQQGIRISVGPLPCPAGCSVNVDYLYAGSSYDSGHITYCDAYAKGAVQQNQENINRHCGFSGARWHSDYGSHYNYCLGTTNAIAAAETSARNADLAKCRQGAGGDRVLGGIDLARYCRTIYGGSASTRLIENNANGWRCVVGTRLQSINIEDACRRQYGDLTAIARYRNFNDPNSWECVIVMRTR
jgi:hypothetical protein